ncbi:MAG: hypothetical protein H6708_17820 [Kofleriaceae bacterium]|nr:hypothetical protein [Kofleriaceae bacterium]
MQAAYGARYHQVSTILFRHDPVGINFATNTDEYEPEVDTILPRLAGARDVADVQRIVHEEMVRWFSAATAGSADRYAALAAEIWRAWRGDRG